MTTKTSTWTWRKVVDFEIWVGKSDGTHEAEIVSTPVMDSFWWAIYDGDVTAKAAKHGTASTLSEAKEAVQGATK